MATKAENIEAINALTESMGVDQINTDEMSAKDLEALLSDLKAKQRDSELETQADNVTALSNKPEAVAVKVIAKEAWVCGVRFTKGEIIIDMRASDAKILVDRGQCEYA